MRQGGSLGEEPASGSKCGAKSLQEMGLYHPRYNSDRFPFKGAGNVTFVLHPVKMRQFMAAGASILLMVPVVPVTPSGIPLAARTNQLNGALKRLEGHLRAAGA